MIAYLITDLFIEVFKFIMSVCVPAFECALTILRKPLQIPLHQRCYLRSKICVDLTIVHLPWWSYYKAQITCQNFFQRFITRAGVHLEMWLGLVLDLLAFVLGLLHVFHINAHCFGKGCSSSTSGCDGQVFTFFWLLYIV